MCGDNMRLERMQQDPKYQDRIDITQMLKKKVGLWVNNQNMVPTNMRTMASMNPDLNREQNNDPKNKGPEGVTQSTAQERAYRARGVKIGNRERGADGNMFNMDLNDSGLQLGLDPKAKNKSTVAELTQHYQQGSLKRGGSGRDPNPIEWQSQEVAEDMHSTGSGSQEAGPGDFV